MQMNIARFRLSAAFASFGAYVLGLLIGGIASDEYGLWYPSTLHGFGSFFAIAATYAFAPDRRVATTWIAVAVVVVASWLVLGASEFPGPDDHSSWHERYFRHSFSLSVVGALSGGLFATILWHFGPRDVEGDTPNYSLKRTNQSLRD